MAEIADGCGRQRQPSQKRARNEDRQLHVLRIQGRALIRIPNGLSPAFGQLGIENLGTHFDLLADRRIENGATDIFEILPQALDPVTKAIEDAIVALERAAEFAAPSSRRRSRTTATT